MKQSALQDNLMTLLKELPFPKNLQATFFSQESLRHDRQLFLGLASVFAPAFPGLTQAQETLLNAAVYLGSKGIYQLDNVLDLQVNDQQRIDQAYHGQVFMLESQRLLAQLFSLHDDFWPLYYQRVENHYRELSLSKQIDTPLTEENYKYLLAHKYAMLYCPVDALFFLTGKKHQQAYQIILDSLQWFCKGYNMPNEIMGLAEDIQLKINNYAFWRIKAHLEQLSIDPTSFSHEDLHKMLYVSGLAVEMMDEAIAALHQAKRITVKLNLQGYQRLLCYRIENVEERKAYILQTCEDTF